MLIVHKSSITFLLYSFLLTDSTSLCYEVEVVRTVVKQILFGDLWVVLCECLDLVRDLEGIVDVAPELDSSSSSSAMKGGDRRDQRANDGWNRSSSSGSGSGRNPSGGSRGGSRTAAPGGSRASIALARARSHASQGANIGANIPDDDVEENGMELSLSALTMRFMPLIECFLTVCGSTSLRTPPLAGSSSEDSHSSSNAVKEVQGTTPLVKRKASEISATTSPIGTPVIPALATAGASTVASAPAGTEITAVTEQDKLVELRAADAAAIAHAIRALSDTVPGARFRNNTGYLQMQLELDESSPAAPLLLRFADKNRVLLNMVLKNNVHLLESSFSALITVPRCRHLLHFDIKR